MFFSITASTPCGFDTSVRRLNTFSVDYVDNDKNFVKSEFQPNSDNYYIDIMKRKFNTNHQQIVIDTPELAESLEEAMLARDYPGMADVDSSLLLFCKNISRKAKVAISGECADEIFGGYPWFYKEELYNQPYFPWMRELDEKIMLFHPDIRKLNIKDYIIEQYQKTLEEIKTDDFKKKMMYLNKEWFMQTLLTRCDSQTMRSSIEVRVPFANVKIFEYIYNIPYSYMFLNNEEKGLLRKAFEDH